MTSPLLSSRNSPRKIISENSDTRSPASSRLAQLVSKFEFLDAVASVGTSQRASPNSKLVTAISPPAVVGLTASKIPKRESRGSTITRERSSIDSRFSPVRFATSSLEPTLTRRVQTFGTKSPTVPIRNADMKSRQKSVAERRIIFEAASQQPEPSTSPGESLIPRPPPLRLAHSKSWRSLKSKRSAARPATDDAPGTPESTGNELRRLSKPLSPAPQTVPLPRTLLASDDHFGTWRSPLNRPDDSWASFKRSCPLKAAPDASPSDIRSQYTEASPQRDQRVSIHGAKFNSMLENDLVERNLLIGENRKHGWMDHARKMASSFSNTVSGETSSQRNKSVGSPGTFEQIPINKNDLMSFKLTGTSNTGRSKLPQSKISGLRKRFSQSKGQTSVAIVSADKERHELALAETGLPISPSRIPLLKSCSSTESEELKTSTLRSKSYTPYRSQSFSKSLHTPVRRRNTEKNDSPLQQKISLFESLDRHNSVPYPVRTTTDTRKSCTNSGEQGRNDSTIAPLRSFRGKLKRISTSCRRTPSEWSTTSSRDVRDFVVRSSDTSPVAQEERAATVADEALSPRTTDVIPIQPILKQTFLTSEVSPLVLEKPLSFPRSPSARPGYNLDGEAGLGVAPLPLFAEPQRRFSRTKNTFARAANRLSLQDVEKEFELIELLEDNLKSVSDDSLPVLKARCLLEQPKPVNAKELKRLVSLCKEKVRKISGGRSE
ncbi:hypothetical protein NW768_005356 [Fusarium equiseti]|uniref:Uncharacterized protein n=1 Tax=Fusarium equiseti TaxID=61235 RepID=A0ABQ8RF10_FUSEQ|nr:hypothetical protein NW768_005356 [Fusarium equiseti]